ncbi:hypothetical protein AN478_12000 [Thiohalorhabdus denitrificans]|nr:hypothetical protein AN478_12000 [Thiohalorhabdus denitrificans]
MFPGMFPLLGLAALPLLTHGYLNAGLVFQVLLVIIILSAAPSLQIVAKAGVLFLGVLLVFVLLGAVLTGNLFFLRGENFPFSFYLATPLSNPNVVARTIVIVLPLLLLARLQGVLRTKAWWLLLVGGILTIAVVAMSRANILALVVMFLYWVLVGRGGVSVGRLLQYGALILLVAGLAFAVSPLQEKFERAAVLVGGTYQLLQQAEGNHLVYEHAPARAKTWAASLLLLQQKPLFGAGPSAKEWLGQAGAQKGGKTIAVHGAFLNILTSNGFVGLSLFLVALYRLFRGLGSVGRMFLLGALVSQIGADIYAHTLFWAVLGLLLLFDQNRRNHPRSSYQVGGTLPDERAIA